LIKNIHIGHFIGLAACLGLAACATNVIRIDRANTMTAAGRIATDKTRALMDDVRSENRRFLIDLVASDSRCAIGKGVDPIIVYPPRKGLRLCRGNAAAGRGDFVVRRLTKTDFAPSLTVIEGLVAYLDAVDAIASRKPLDLDGTIGGAYDDLQGTLDDVATITQSEPLLPALSADQRNAVKGTLDLLGEILDQAVKVDDLRKLERSLNPAAFTTNLAALTTINGRWLDRLDAEVDSRKALVTARLLRTRSFAERRGLAGEQLGLLEQAEMLQQLELQLARTVTALDTAHAAYVRLLFGTGRDMTLSEKRKAAAITRGRLRTALSSLANLITAF
jgi:hypothetical protein